MRNRGPRRMALVIVIVITMSLILGIPAAANLWLHRGDTAQIMYTGGSGVAIRAEPGIEAGVAGNLPEGFPVLINDGPLTIDDGSSWYHVTAETADGALSGWVDAGYLDLMMSAYVDEIPDEADDAARAVPLPVTTDGFALNLHLGPSEAEPVILSIPSGAYVDVLAPAVADINGVRWSQIRYDETIGYGMSAYLGTPMTVSGSGSSAPRAVVSDTDGMGLNVRAEPNLDAPVLTAMIEGSTVELIDGPVAHADDDAWFQVWTGNVTGWANVRYLAAMDAGTELAPASGADSVGMAIASEALAYRGVPYLWAGTTPVGFDCSGFTYYILNQVLGGGVPRPMEDQIVSGIFIGQSELVPGDVVFFQNTYKWGVSHVGFYLGDTLFVHAGLEHGGVGVSSLNDPYWQSRYLTARRIR